MLTLDLIKQAASRIAGRVHRTPVVTSRATNKILSLTDEEKRHGVIAVSSGNHAQAVALAAREAGIRAVVCIPADAPKMKIEAAREYGADIRFFDRQRDDRDAFGRDIAAREGLVMVPAYDDYLIMAGQGTCGLEFLEEVSDLDCLLTPCSGGGLFAGVSTAARAINPRMRCFAVEPEIANDTQQSIAKGERVKIPPPPTIADGLRVQSPGELTFPITQQNAEDVLTVADEEIIETLRFILFRTKLLVEPSGVAAAAAVLFKKLPEDLRRVGVVLSGGNIDPDILSQLMH